MAHYNKGANAERELIHTLFDYGFAVLRVAGSGVSPLPSPDVVALKQGKILAFECKAWRGNYLAIPLVTMNDEINWAKTAGAEFFIAWKIPHEGWLFIKAEHFHNAGKNFMVSLEEAKKCSISLQLLAGVQVSIKP
ncbi:MAG: Holliday junction resolvase Hjc [archaeon]